LGWCTKGALASRSTAKCTPPAARNAAQLAVTAADASALFPPAAAAASATTGDCALPAGCGSEAEAGSSAACSTCSSVWRSGREGVRSASRTMCSRPVKGPAECGTVNVID